MLLLMGDWCQSPLLSNHRSTLSSKFLSLSLFPIFVRACIGKREEGSGTDTAQIDNYGQHDAGTGEIQGQETVAERNEEYNDSVYTDCLVEDVAPENCREAAEVYDGCLEGSQG